MTPSYGKALVTGGAGFIGSHITQALVARGCEVTVLDNLTSGHLKNLDGVKTDITFVEGDIRDEETLADAVAGCDVVFHQAAVVSVTKTVDQPVQSTIVNDIGTLNVLEAARRQKTHRVVLASSSAVYGDDPHLPKTESMTPNPLSPYAVQKLTNEYHAQLYHRLYGMETVCLRYFNVFGPRQDPGSPYSGVISIFMARAIRGDGPIIYGDGRQTRDFVYVKDVVSANLLAAAHKRAPGHVFNIGTSRSVEINTLWNSIARLAGVTVAPEYSDARVGDIVHSLAGIRKAIDLLEFTPAISFEEGLRQTLDWYRQNT